MEGPLVWAGIFLAKLKQQRPGIRGQGVSPGARNAWAAIYFCGLFRRLETVLDHGEKRKPTEGHRHQGETFSPGDELSLFYELGEIFSRKKYIPSAGKVVLDRTIKFLGASWGALILLDKARQEVSIQESIPGQKGRYQKIDMKAARQKGILSLFSVNSFQLEPLKPPRLNSLQKLGLSQPALLSAPVRTREEVIGAFCVARTAGSHQTSSRDLKLLSALGHLTGYHLANTQLYEQLEALFLNTVQALVSAIDARDPYTHGHSERVAELSWTLARQVGLGTEAARNVRLAGILHDIGKIGLPDYILTKPGKLTPGEFSLVKSHPEMGARIAGHVGPLAPVVDGILYHHERVDGTGYPQALKGEAIPLPGRIVAVADTFDAMTSPRSYRGAVPRWKALKFLKETRGTKYEPKVVNALIQICAASGLRK